MSEKKILVPRVRQVWNDVMELFVARDVDFEMGAFDFNYVTRMVDLTASGLKAPNLRVWRQNNRRGVVWAEAVRVPEFRKFYRDLSICGCSPSNTSPYRVELYGRIEVGFISPTGRQLDSVTVVVSHLRRSVLEEI